MVHDASSMPILKLGCGRDAISNDDGVFFKAFSDVVVRKGEHVLRHNALW